jgi:hypothetical protein
MGRAKLYLIETDRDVVVDSQGPLPLFHKRLKSLVLVGSSSTPRDGLMDTGSPLTIFPERIWKNHRQEIEWFTTPPSSTLKSWWSSISGVTGGAVPCELGRISLTVIDLSGNTLRPIPVVAKFAQDNGLLPNRVILGLWGGILEGRRLMLDSSATDAWLEE